jgi:hypothetical protein
VAEHDGDTEYWRTTDVAAYLEVTVQTVSAYRRRGQMPEPDLTLGSLVLWRPATVIAWHKQRPRVGAGTDAGGPTADEVGPQDFRRGTAMDHALYG